MAQCQIAEMGAAYSRSPNGIIFPCRGNVRIPVGLHSSMQVSIVRSKQRFQALARIIADRFAAYRWKCPEVLPEGRYLQNVAWEFW